MSGGLFQKLRGLIAPQRGTVPGTEDDGTYRVQLIVGLGNPGGDYAGNRHNLGFWAVNRLARRHAIEFSHSGQVSLAEGEISGHQVTLAKPRTFVNKSGLAVWNLIKRLDLHDARELLVVCDDIDMPVAKMRLRASGGFGGQNGLKSIIESIGNEQFPRLRIGVGRPFANGEPSYEPSVVGDYLLSDPPPEERDHLDKAVDRALSVIELVLSDGVEAAMRKYN